MVAKYKPKNAFFWGQNFYSVKKNYPADDYQVMTNPHLFDNLDDLPVEQATAAPGETRKRKRPAPKKG
jgi:hypothetical protein